jgi:N-sulfoglucosamine sulfohydrolase
MKNLIFSLSILFSLAFVIIANAQERPNILVVVCEDISPYLGCYGDKVAVTPNLDKFATEAIRYTRMFTPVGVCAPSRAVLITGMYPTSIGANQMRNFSLNPNDKGFPEGIKPYEVVLPEGVKCYTEYMRTSGYYCSNNQKTDYQFAPPLTAWDECSKKAHWKNRPKDQPFFSVFNLEVTHESQIWNRTNIPLVVDPNKIILPPYYPEDPIIRHDMAVLYSNINEMDKQVQQLIDEVATAGLLDNTIILFYSDNGGPMPRGKRALYESGTLVPFMIRFPDGYRKGEVEMSLCSFVDIPSTILSLAGIKPPNNIQGQAFLGKYAAKPREYVYGARNRFDEVIDKMGYVRDSKYRYIKNYMPEIANYLPNAYRLQMPMMRRMIDLLEKDSLNKVQKQWFKAPRLIEEFYDVDKDPHEINNLINDPFYKTDIDRLRKAYNAWDGKYNALWKKSEKECRELFFPGGKQKIAEKPEVKNTRKGVTLFSKTKGASFAYQINETGLNKKHWFTYSKPIVLKKGDILRAVAVRVGYKNSKEITYSIQ